MIAVTFALPDESGVFIRQLRDVSLLEKGSLPVVRGFFGDLEIVVFHTGVGLESARTRLSRFFTNQKPRLLICSGFAGGLDPSLQTGDLIVATNISSAALLSYARQLFSKNERLFFGALATVEIPAESVASKQALATSTGALAVDMETSAVAAVCAAASIPLFSLRGISDTASQALPVPFSSWFDATAQRPRPLALVCYLISHPGVILPFVRFVKGVFKTKTILADRLSDFLSGGLEVGTCSQD